MAEEEEVVMEVEAVQAVYEDDCVVLDSFPPHLHIHIKPRTADISSQQFVEATIRIRAGRQYPEEPPCIDIIESKGLDEKRQKHLIDTIRDKATELSSCLMLVALCEEAVAELSVMNHPDGDCPLCLHPLVSEDENNKFLPFMKLMSCFHCFHSECIIMWWNWLQKEKETKTGDLSNATLYPSGDTENKKDMHGVMKESMGICPVCRKVFHSKDIEHVLDLVGTHSSQLSPDVIGDDDEELLKSESENIRRQKFEAILKLQEENSGLIEPKRTVAVQPGMGMFLPQPVASLATTSSGETIEEQQRDAAVTSETNSSGPSNSSRPSTSEHRTSSGMRKHRARKPRNQEKQWVRKANDTAG